MKRFISIALSLLLLLSIVPASASAAPANLTREDAAVFLAEKFALADIYASDIEGFEATPKDLGYTESSGAITAKNVVAAAKDCVALETAPKIEAVINAQLLPLAADGLSFNPDAEITVREFATAVAKAMYGADLQIDHLQKAIDAGLFNAADITDEPLTQAQADSLFAFLDNVDVVAVFATADIHGNYLPYTSTDGLFTIGSVARIKALMDEVEAKVGEENVIYVDGGDSPYNTTLANTFLGEVSVDALNALGLDATVLGNHDFDYSFENLLKLRDRAEYAMLSANTKFKEGKNYDGEEDYPFGDAITIEAAGLKFGIFGVTDDQSAATTLFSNTYDIEFDDDLTSAAATVNELKNMKNCDVVIALSHVHSKNKQLVTDNPDVDISIGGGNDIAGRPTIINDDQYLINPSKHGEALNQINVVVYDGYMTGVIYSQIFLTEAYEEDAEVKALIDGYNTELDEKLNTVIGYSAQNLEWSTQLVRGQNSPIANLVTDALRNYFATSGLTPDICLVNGGGMRAAIPEGGVTIKNCASVLPFDNDMMLVETSGATVVAALENGASALPGLNGKFAQPSGITYTVDLNNEVGSRVSDVKLADGTPIDPEARYKVVINSFIAGGGDGYTMFNVLDETKEMATDVTVLTHPNKTYMRDALQAYFEKSSEEDPVTVDMDEVRIKIIEEKFPNPFTDVKEGTWYYDFVMEMAEAGIMLGTSETTFKPDATLTRAQLAAMLYRLAGEPPIDLTTVTNFEDVPADKWYAKSVAWAKENKLVYGVTDTTFAPEAVLTREQAAAMLWRSKGEPEAAADLSKFEDAGSVSAWAQKAVNWAVANGLISGAGSGGKLYLNPQGIATRAQAAKLMSDYSKLK